MEISSWECRPNLEGETGFHGGGGEHVPPPFTSPPPPPPLPFLESQLGIKMPGITQPPCQPFSIMSQKPLSKDVKTKASFMR